MRLARFFDHGSNSQECERAGIARSLAWIRLGFILLALAGALISQQLGIWGADSNLPVPLKPRLLAMFATGGALLLLYVLTARACRRAMKLADDTLATLDQLGLQLDRQVHDNRRIERALQNSTHLLHQSEAKLRGLFDQSSNFIGLLTTEGVLIDANRTALVASGIEAVDVLGRPFVETPWWTHSADLQLRLKQAIELANTGITDRFEATHLAADGSTIHVDFSLKPITDKTERIIFLVSEGRDVTLQKLHEAQLHQILQNLAQSNRELEQFAYVASHDLQEPLRKITSYGELLGDKCEGNIDEAGMEYLSVITSSALRLKKLVRDLLSFSRITTEGKELKPVNANDCVAAAIEDLEVIISETHAQVTFDPLPTVLADGVQLTMLFRNLISNAIKYRDESRVPRVHIGVRPLQDQTEFHVQDNGIGIESQHFEKIFEIFKRLHNRRKYSGTGIGLALCKRIVDRIGGKIHVESTPGTGSRFCFTARPASFKPKPAMFPSTAMPMPMPMPMPVSEPVQL